MNFRFCSQNINSSLYSCDLENSNPEDLQKYMKDFAYGNLEPGEINESDVISKAINLEQLILQYIIYCQEVLKEQCEYFDGLKNKLSTKKELIINVIKSKQQKKKRLFKEMKEADRIINMHLTLLENINPGLHSRIKVFEDGHIAVRKREIKKKIEIKKEIVEASIQTDVEVIREIPESPIQYSSLIEQKPIEKKVAIYNNTNEEREKIDLMKIMRAPPKPPSHPPPPGSISHPPPKKNPPPEAKMKLVPDEENLLILAEFDQVIHGKKKKKNIDCDEVKLEESTSITLNDEISKSMIKDNDGRTLFLENDDEIIEEEINIPSPVAIEIPKEITKSRVVQVQPRTIEEAISIPTPPFSPSSIIVSSSPTEKENINFVSEGAKISNVIMPDEEIKNEIMQIFHKMVDISVLSENSVILIPKDENNLVTKNEVHEIVPTKIKDGGENDVLSFSNLPTLNVVSIIDNSNDDSLLVQPPHLNISNINISDEKKEDALISDSIIPSPYTSFSDSGSIALIDLNENSFTHGNSPAPTSATESLSNSSSPKMKSSSGENKESEKVSNSISNRNDETYSPFTSDDNLSNLGMKEEESKTNYSPNINLSSESKEGEIKNDGTILKSTDYPITPFVLSTSTVNSLELSKEDEASLLSPIKNTSHGIDEGKSNPSLSTSPVIDSINSKGQLGSTDNSLKEFTNMLQSHHTDNLMSSYDEHSSQNLTVSAIESPDLTPNNKVEYKIKEDNKEGKVPILHSSLEVSPVNDTSNPPPFENSIDFNTKKKLSDDIDYSHDITFHGNLSDSLEEDVLIGGMGNTMGTTANSDVVNTIRAAISKVQLKKEVEIKEEEKKEEIKDEDIKNLRRNSLLATVNYASEEEEDEEEERNNLSGSSINNEIKNNDTKPVTLRSIEGVEMSLSLDADSVAASDMSPSPYHEDSSDISFSFDGSPKASNKGNSNSLSITLTKISIDKMYRNKMENMKASFLFLGNEYKSEACRMNFKFGFATLNFNKIINLSKDSYLRSMFGDSIKSNGNNALHIPLSVYNEEVLVGNGIINLGEMLESGSDILHEDVDIVSSDGSESMMGYCMFSCIGNQTLADCWAEFS